MEVPTSRIEDQFLNDPGYKRGFGAYKPKFQGIPEGYYPNSFGNIIVIIILCFTTYAECIGLWVALIFWAFEDTATYVYVWCGLTLFYILVVVCWMIYGGKMRVVREKAMIQEKIQLEQAMIDDQNAAAKIS